MRIEDSVQHLKLSFFCENSESSIVVADRIPNARLKTIEAKNLFKVNINYFMTEVLIIDLQCMSMDWFLYDRDLPHERVKDTREVSRYYLYFSLSVCIYQ